MRGFKHSTYAFVALCLAWMTIQVMDNLQQRARLSIPAESWFKVNNIYVPDYRIGDNPMITYDRRILEEFQGFWIVEMQRLDPASGAFFAQCSGAGLSNYEPADFIPNNRVAMDWFIGRECTGLPPGKYQLRVSYTLRRIGWPDKSVVAYSNVFTIAL